MKDEYTLLAGTQWPDATPWAPFDARAVDFLSALSEAILRDPVLRQQENNAAFGFWCRRSRLEQLAQRHASPWPRLGRGLVLHLAPANVPELFAYTFAIGLLAGNANLVRLSSRCAETQGDLLRRIECVLAGHPEVWARTALVTYPRESGCTAELCARCDARVVWGGDETVAALRTMPMPPHGVELAFPDRRSLAVLSQRLIDGLDGEALRGLAHRFYKDTYPMDQNACSSPQLVVWLEDGGNPACRARWWEAVAAVAVERYPFGPFQAARKLERLCLSVMTGAVEGRVERYGGNYLHLLQLASLPRDLDSLRGGFGLFYTCGISRLEDLLPLLTPKVQTLVCGGLEPAEVSRFLARRHALGVDRVVTLGQALEMDTIWDGKDLIAGLSRMIL